MVGLGLQARLFIGFVGLKCLATAFGRKVLGGHRDKSLLQGKGFSPRSRQHHMRRILHDGAG